MSDNLIKDFLSGSDGDIKTAIVDFNKKHVQTFTFPDYNVEMKKKMLEVALNHLAANENSRIPCLEFIRILSREKIALSEIFTKPIISHLLKLAGLVASQQQLLDQSETTMDFEAVVEAQKILCNLIYNSPDIQKECSHNDCINSIMLRLRMYKDPSLPSEVKFFDMRMLFLITALCADVRPKLRLKKHGVIYLMEVLDLILKSNAEQASAQDQKGQIKRRSKKKKGTSHHYVPCLNNEEVELCCEVLKVLFNLTVCVDKTNVEEEEESQFMRLVCILHDLLLCEAKSPEKKEELQSHTINLLTNMPPSCYEELLMPATDDPSEKQVVFEGTNMDAIDVMLEFLEKRLNQPHKTYKELLAPVLTTLCEASRSCRFIRKFLRSKVLPPLKDVMNRPEEGSTLRNKLVKLMTSPVFDVKELVADFLFVLCKEKVIRLIKYTGYGNAAGLLANRGLMLGGRGSSGNYSSDSEDSDTEEYLKFKEHINPVVGCYQEPRPNPMDGLSEEQKEYEAIELVRMMDKMARDGLVQPMMVGMDGKPHVVNHILELQEARRSSTDSKQDSSDLD